MRLARGVVKKQVKATQPRIAKRVPDPVRCGWCSQPFRPKSKLHRFCSEKCRHTTTGEGKGHSKGKTLVPRRICVICGDTFYAPPVQVRRGGALFCSKGCKGVHMAKNPQSWPAVRGRRGNGGRRADLDNRYFRSTWEANYARYLNWQRDRGMIRGWEYEADVFEFPVKRGSRTYTPDFKVTHNDGTIEYQEVKGWMDQRSATKIKRMGIHHPSVRLTVIDKAAYAAIGNALWSAIPGWEKAGKHPVRKN